MIAEQMAVGVLSGANLSMMDADLEIGTPLKFSRNGATVYGRVKRFEGDKYDGRYPIVVMATPHGTEVLAGRCYFALMNEEDLEELRMYELLKVLDDFQPALAKAA